MRLERIYYLTLANKVNFNVLECNVSNMLPIFYKVFVIVVRMCQTTVHLKRRMTLGL